MPHRNRGHTYVSHLGADARGTTALSWLADHYRHSDTATWAARLAAGEVTVDDVVATPTTPLRAGQTLAWRRPPWDEPDAPTDVVTVHVDAHVRVVDKPSGLPTLPSGGYLDHTLLAQVTAVDPHAVPMHRLGTGTSGLVLFARTPQARRELQAAWRDHAVTKTYLAVVSGRPTWDAAVLDTPIGPVPHAALGTVHAASPHGKPSRSVARVVGACDDGTVVQVDLHTGRPHQIRIHLAAAGHPLVGDPLYVPGGHARDDARPTETGYRLHASTLVFRHPGTGDRCRFHRAPPWPDLPADLADGSNG
ncbi:MAG: RNA pseudouridine synthase [Alphaproteobacteria bacterium]|nr:RNA pseudouridine synthase [Alphaproteobacteria bacterium]